MMAFVDPDAIGECDARTQGGSIVVTIGPTEDAAARRRVHPGDTIVHCVRASLPARAASTPARVDAPRGRDTHALALELLCVAE
jgi:hypothetical protein